MRLPKCVLRIVNVFTIEAGGEGDCLFNLFVQGLNTSCYNDLEMIHSLSERLHHFVPMLHKTSAHNKLIYIYIIYISQIQYWN